MVALPMVLCYRLRGLDARGAIPNAPGENLTLHDHVFPPPSFFLAFSKPLTLFVA